LNHPLLQMSILLVFISYAGSAGNFGETPEDATRYPACVVLTELDKMSASQDILRGLTTTKQRGGMKRRILSGILFAVVIALPVRAQQAAKPLSKEQVAEFVKVGMEPAKLVQLIHDHNINFDPADFELEALRKDGAPEAVLQALREARPKPLTRDQVLALVAQNISTERAAALVKQRGVDFLADDAFVDNLRLAGGTDDLIAAVRVASAAATLPIRQLLGHTNRVNDVKFSPDGTLLASASRDKTVKLWDVATGSLRQTLQPPNSNYSNTDVLSAAFSPDGKHLAVVVADDNKITIWDVATGSVERSISILSPSAVAFSPDGKLLALGGANHGVILFDVATGARLQALWGHKGHIDTVTFSPDGKLVASGGWDSTAKLWDVGTGSLLHTLSGSAAWVSVVAFSPDGRLLASGSLDGTVKLWDVATGALRQTLAGNQSVEFLSFTPDGKFLASGYMHDVVRLWDVATGEMKESHDPWRPDFFPICMALSPDGKHFASGENDNSIIIWRLKP
jgi:WD40 repeat protein